MECFFFLFSSPCYDIIVTLRQYFRNLWVPQFSRTQKIEEELFFSELFFYHIKGMQIKNTLNKGFKGWSAGETSTVFFQWTVLSSLVWVNIINRKFFQPGKLIQALESRIVVGGHWWSLGVLIQLTLDTKSPDPNSTEVNWYSLNQGPM